MAISLALARRNYSFTSSKLGNAARSPGITDPWPAPHSGGLVTMKSEIGASRIVVVLSGEQLPRIR